MKNRVAMLPLLLAAMSCKASPDQARKDPKVAENLLKSAHPKHPIQALLHERSGGGKVRYLGFDLSTETPKRGDVVELTHYFQVEEVAVGSPDILVHGDLPGGGRSFVGDHGPVGGRLPVNHWKKGEIWRDRHPIRIPDDVPTPMVSLYVGFFKGNARWTVEGTPKVNDGKNRIFMGSLRLTGKVVDDLPEVVVMRTNEAITPDGKLDESVWNKANPMRFLDSMGRNTKTRFPTTLKLLYDDTNLYVGFDCVDQDITERYKKRDDPIYEHETAEVFIMPHTVAPALGRYIELQASPGGIIFDASFTGRRQGMDKTWNADQKVGTQINGTLNQEDKDKGWVSEWVVPWKSLRWVEKPPTSGEEWRMNAFRIEKFGPKGAEYTAWSPPKVGDFHNVLRFGRMKFE